jgi:hypothetical protein
MRSNSRPRRLAAVPLAWAALVVAAFYAENGEYLLTKLTDFLRFFRSALG